MRMFVIAIMRIGIELGIAIHMVMILMLACMNVGSCCQSGQMDRH